MNARAGPSSGLIVQFSPADGLQEFTANKAHEDTVASTRAPAASDRRHSRGQDQAAVETAETQEAGRITHFTLLRSRFSVRVQLQVRILRSSIRAWSRQSAPQQEPNVNTNREARTAKCELDLQLGLWWRLDARLWVDHHLTDDQSEQGQAGGGDEKYGPDTPAGNQSAQHGAYRHPDQRGAREHAEARAM